MFGVIRLTVLLSTKKQSITFNVNVLTIIYGRIVEFDEFKWIFIPLGKVNTILSDCNVFLKQLNTVRVLIGITHNIFFSAFLILRGL